MALGVPVVAARVGGLPEVVGPDAGLLVPPGDPAALAAAVGELARDPGRRSAMGTAGRARVAERFSLDRQAELVHEAYRDTLASGARARLRPRGAR
jgi:glycosyltransferase involved in cell wall biosynthesis